MDWNSTVEAHPLAFVQPSSPWGTNSRGPRRRAPNNMTSHSSLTPALTRQTPTSTVARHLLCDIAYASVIRSAFRSVLRATATATIPHRNGLALLWSSAGICSCRRSALYVPCTCVSARTILWGGGQRCWVPHNAPQHARQAYPSHVAHTFSMERTFMNLCHVDFERFKIATSLCARRHVMDCELLGAEPARAWCV